MLKRWIKDRGIIYMEKFEVELKIVKSKIHEEDYTGHCGVGADFNHRRSGNRRNAVGKIFVQQGNGGFDGILRGNRGQAGNRFAG